jgi:hypothetical protein
MLWLIATAGGVGLLFGLGLFRVHVIAVLSVALALGCIVVALFAHWTLWGTAIYAIVSISSLQFGYLAGSGFACSRATDAEQADTEAHDASSVAPINGNMRSHI